MMKCSCGNTATGTLLTYYHDGCGILEYRSMCNDCGARLHNPVATYSRDGEDPHLRPRVFIMDVVSRDYRMFSAYTILYDYLEQK